MKVLMSKAIKHVLFIVVTIIGCILTKVGNAQTPLNYKAPQDTAIKKRAQNESLTTYQKSTQILNVDSRLKGAAVKAAEILKDTSKYNTKTGIALDQLFEKSDLEYVADKGINDVIVLFGLINESLPKGQYIGFKTEPQQNSTIGENPLVLKNLRAIIAAKPATITGDKQQWKENVYQAYRARDYGTKLENTITITSATREVRESPKLTFIDFNGKPITLEAILRMETAKINNQRLAEKAAVAGFRNRTFPNDKISMENANENYKRALYELMRLQEGDINRHPQSQKLIYDLTADLKKGDQSLFMNALKNSTFFDANVPGNLGPVLVTESNIISPDQVMNNAGTKAMELFMLAALHYGERDAIKLIRRVLSGNGSVPARQQNDFTPKRLNELTYHGAEKFKSLGFGEDKTRNMTSADLLLVAVASPVAPVQDNTLAFVTLQQVGSSIINKYETLDIQETKNTLLFNPRIKLSSRHTEYRAANDALDYVPDFVGGKPIGQKGSRVTQNGVELRLESDLYFSNLKKIVEKGVKPTIFPEFGIIAGTGTRSVGYDNSTTPGKFGAVPQFRNNFITWGAHIGLNVGPILLSQDATIISTRSNDDPYTRFFDLSEAMTYYRYSLLAHVINFGFGNFDQGKGVNVTLDAEFAGETNNEWYHDITHTQNTAMQIGSKEWDRDHARSHPNGVFNQQIATEMIVNGDAKASYASSNFAALHFGAQRSGFQIRASLGLYNLYSIPHDNSIGKIISNTAKGNLFAAVGLTYNFGSTGSYERKRKKESYQSINGIESPHKIEESSSATKSQFGPRDHAIFTNKKSRTISTINARVMSNKPN
ncbi:hypothetical protein [Mucilaginibacter sp.]|jgi:hypothetical protein|uniref:hypothetical protein n=1 Tax=Mucilaginibacter sp. TaxID=1882438 RepID=UPI003562979E